MKLLGVRIDNLEKDQIIQKIKLFLDEPAFHQIATVNPEFILRSQSDSDFKRILQSSDLNVADGVGIKIAFLRFGKFLKARIAGVDLVDEILKIANEKKSGVFLAVNKHGLSSYAEIKAALEKKYPDIEFFGDTIDKEADSSYKIQNAKYQILICNFGFPEQEKFIARQKNGTIRLAIGVGGSFDFISGKIKRAPNFLRKAGLEWLWRFFQEPRYRAKRIFKAVIIFPVKILFSKNQNE